MGRFEQKVVLITGAARGQGRAHAEAFAHEGASLAICDICEDIASVPYALGTESELAETVALCEALDAPTISAKVDVRSADSLDAFAQETIERFGGIDVAVANAGVFSIAPILEQPAGMFEDVVDVCLKGVYNTIRAVLPSMVEREYGRIVATGSYASVAAAPYFAHYGAAKHGLAGLVKSVAREVGDKGITINYVVPNGVATPMVRHETMYGLANPDEPTEAAAMEVFAAMNPIPLAWVEPEDVAKVVLFMASDDARYMTGSAVKIDLGLSS